jgi:hypothetical protein
LIKTIFISLPLSLFLLPPGWGQTASVPAQQSNPTKLAFLLPGIFGPDGLLLPNPTHEAHFESDFQANFGPFNTAIGSQLTSLPLPSPASGFTYSFDPALGVYTRSAQSYGPILAERAETIGKEKFFAGFSFQHFRFSSLDGLDLHNIPSVFRHSQTTPDPIIKEDIITTRNFIDTQIDQFTMFFTYGLSDRVDLSVAVPVLNAKLAAISNATIQRIGTANDPTIHYFLDPNGNSTNQKQFAVSGTASGLGDVLMRIKGTVAEWKPVWLSAGLDIRMPTGDAYDFLGSGTLGLRPFLAISSRNHRVTPHLNAGFQWNGSSPLAGDIFAGTSGHLPNQITYAAGFDAGLNSKLSFAMDVLGQDVMHAQVVRPATFIAANGTSWQDTAFSRRNVNIVNGSAGFKVNPIGTVLVSFNALFRMNDAGLRSKVVPLVGLSYTF